MKKRVFSIVQLAIILIILICMALIWPLKAVLKSERVSASTERGMVKTLEISDLYTLKYQFRPTLEDLSSISFRTYTQGSASENGSFYLTVFDSKQNIICTSSISRRNVSQNGYTSFQLSKELNTGEDYVIYLTTSDCEDSPVYLYTGSAFTASPEYQKFSKNDTELDQIPCASFVYRDSLTFHEALAYDVILCVMGIFIGVIFSIAGRKNRLHVFFSFTTILLLILMYNEGDKPIQIAASDLHRTNGIAQYGTVYAGEADGISGSLAKSDTYSLRKGTYQIGFEYDVTTEGSYMLVTADQQEYTRFALTPNIGYQTYEFVLDKDMEEVRFEFFYSGTGNLIIRYLQLTPEKSFYTDNYFLAVSFIFLFAAGYAVLMRYRKKVKSASTQNAVYRSEVMTVAMVIVIGVIACIPLFSTSLIWGDDIAYHLSRIEGIKDGLRDGQFPVILYPEGMSGHGYLNTMYPSLFLYIPAILRLFGVSIAMSYKTLLLLANFGMAAATYLSASAIIKCTKKIDSSNSTQVLSVRKTALLITGVYVLCPYHMTNFYARAALGEALAMIFLPLVIAGLYKIVVGDSKKYGYLVIGMTGLFNTHILSVALACILCAITALVFIVPLIREKRILNLLKAAGITLLVNLGFLVPFLFYYIKGDLNTNSLNWSTYYEYSQDLSMFFGTLTNDGYRQLTLGIPVVFLLFMVPAYLFCKKSQDEKVKKEKYFFAMIFVICCVFTFMMINQFDANGFLEVPLIGKMLKTIQFPTRLLGVISCMSVLIGGICLAKNEYLTKFLNPIIVTLILICVVTNVREYSFDFTYKDYTSTYTKGHYIKVEGILKGDNTVVYPPEWRPLGLTDEAIRSTKPVSDSNEVQNITYQRNGTNTEVSFTAGTRSSELELPLAYYKGYKIEDENNKVVSSYRNLNGKLSFTTPADGKEHSYKVSFPVSPWFIISMLISIVTVVACVLGWIRILMIKKRFRENEKISENM